MKAARDLLKHSSVYAVGQILSRFASVLLLPLYTRCLSPADYGCVAILDLTAGVLAILIGSGMATAVVRMYFDTQDEIERSRVWSTGLVWILMAATFFVLPMILGRQHLADLTLGRELSDGAFFYLLALATLWMNTVSELLETYLRTRKWSGIYVSTSLGRLLLNIGLNVWFLVGLDLGVTGLLAGNLIAASVNTLVLSAVFLRSLPQLGFDTTVLRRLLTFGSPLIIQAMLSMLMHEADRYILRTHGTLDQVGVYSLAYKIGQAVNTLAILPFGAIWSVVLYEIAAQPDAPQIYARVFRYYISGLLVVMLAASLCAIPVLPMLTPGDFGNAVDLIPVVLLAFVFFSMHLQFNVPALLAKRSAALIPASVVGVIVNVVSNLLLIPRFGATGAAWASVATYAAYSFTGLCIYRRFDRYPYPFGRCLLTALGVGATYLGVRMVAFPVIPNLFGQLAISVFVTCAWVAVLFGPVAIPVIELLEAKLGRRLLPQRLRPTEPAVS